MDSNNQATSTPWTHRLAHILSPPSYTTQSTAYSKQLLPSARHPPGEIWKHIFSACIHHDLGTFETTLTWKRNARFVRLEKPGLSGVILFEIPVKRDIDGSACPEFMIEDVFGRKEAQYKDAMSITQVLDSTQAKLVYFPAYACTSFIAGQVMRATLSNAHNLRPHPTREGFFVSLATSDGPPCHEDRDHGALTNESQVPITTPQEPELEELSATDSDSERTDEQCDSSLDSFGPQTPPRDSPPIQEYAAQKFVPKSPFFECEE